MKIKILPVQSFLDLAIQHTGDAGNAFFIALENGKSLTDELEAGEGCSIPGVEQNKDILNYYQAKRLQPATGLSIEQLDKPTLQGIDYWTIQTDFIIS